MKDAAILDLRYGTSDLPASSLVEMFRISSFGFRVLVSSFVLAFILLVCPVFALQPDQLLLIVNSKSLEGAGLAAYYAKRRSVPAQNIVDLQLPVSENLSFDDYERLVVPPIRQFIQTHELRNKIKCLVTFYGVPIRIHSRPQTLAILHERFDIQTDLNQIHPRLEPAVAAVETLAIQLDPAFHPSMASATIDDLTRRTDAASAAITRAINAEKDPNKKNADLQRVMQVYVPLMGLGAVINNLGGHIKFADPAAESRARQALADFQQARSQITALKLRRYDPDSRQKLRQLVKQNFGMIEYARLLQGQLEYLQTKDSGAAFDNELSLVLWDYYPRTRWLANPLRYNFPRSDSVPPTMMVMRIDAPTPQLARRMIDDSIATEKAGLQGIMVIDARSTGGTNNAYAECDLDLAHLASLVRAKTHIPLMYDHAEALITRPPNNPILNVAMYCGWYSPEKYVPAFKFVPGSIGFHIASYTMRTLHNRPGNWCVGMIDDGIDATLGPCDEPYLSAFPKPSEFFPLLMTGKLTLAEVYWKTTPMTSWMISMVGDPLYTPFKEHPALAVTDLPPQLKGIFNHRPR